MPARKKAEPLYFNRELSLLQFNERVLAMAERTDTPALERLRYVCIVGSNLDEFFEIRVSSLKAQIAQHPYLVGPDGLTAEDAFERVQQAVHVLVDRQYALLNEQVLPAL
jgi:polyphosphate kinase